MEESITAEEWRSLSKRGEVCGVFGCDGYPAWKCENCYNFYCFTHKGVHIIACIK